jgi:hypothetical protein
MVGQSFAEAMTSSRLGVGHMVSMKTQWCDLGRCSRWVEEESVEGEGIELIGWFRHSPIPSGRATVTTVLIATRKLSEHAR